MDLAPPQAKRWYTDAEKEAMVRSVAGQMRKMPILALDEPELDETTHLTAVRYLLMGWSQLDVIP